MRDKDLVGKSVVSMADGAKIGTVHDLVFHGLDLDSLLIRGERGEGLLPFKKVGSNGPDALMIESYTLVDWNAGHALAPENKISDDLKKLDVVDSDGTRLGHVHDITLNASGHMEELEVRTEGIFGIGSHETLIDSSRIHAIGEDLITVDAAS